ncbi:hypothetical protein H920_12696 [Fukomys damarensis]|uniref:Uncharacterized protein n=1 Tax=Fukomys damarensis TaxID=885580 RepID=A0A091DSY0_FUKDA|nr:hypothetical protein H920_12696 [Fukomys damarensis]
MLPGTSKSFEDSRAAYLVTEVDLVILEEEEAGHWALEGLLVGVDPAVFQAEEGEEVEDLLVDPGDLHLEEDENEEEEEEDEKDEKEEEDEKDEEEDDFLVGVDPEAFQVEDGEEQDLQVISVSVSRDDSFCNTRESYSGVQPHSLASAP